MNNLQVFNNASFGDLRVIMKDDEYWFVGKDVAEMLGYSNASKAVSVHVDNEDKNFIMLDIADAQNGNMPIGKTKTALINESGLYSLILSSKLPKAKEFKRWVTGEILPSIRKTGSYSMKQENTDDLKAKRAEAMLENARVRKAKMWLELASRTNIKEYKQIAESYAGNTLAGKEVFALPQVEQKTYTATEIAQMLHTTKQKIGMLANKYNLKTPQFGKWFYDKAQHSNKEVESFRYYECAIVQFKNLLGGAVA